MQSTTDHISNNEVGFLFESMLEKINLAMHHPEMQPKGLSNELQDLSKIILNKIRIQFSTFMLVNYKHKPDPYNPHRKVIDIASTNAIIRALLHKWQRGRRAGRGLTAP
ncbi:hypothetical protein, partial [Caldimonas tepidiphila]|uniref:hypothetical protein n=1 Tax=Caldimonas tepidiphila TaxID=2315841 RepID=UPI00196A64F9